MDQLSSKIIGVLLAFVISILAYEVNRLLREIRKVVRRQNNLRADMKEFIRTIFTLMARLYPEKGELINREMQRFLLNSRDDSEEVEGEEEVPISRWRRDTA
jgi:hypothetical protein